MATELSRLRELRSKQYALDKLNTARIGTALWIIVLALSWLWLLIVCIDAKKSLEYWWGLIVVPLSIIFIYHCNYKWDYWSNTIN